MKTPYLFCVAGILFYTLELSSLAVASAVTTGNHQRKGLTATSETTFHVLSNSARIHGKDPIHHIFLSTARQEDAEPPSCTASGGECVSGEECLDTAFGTCKESSPECFCWHLDQATPCKKTSDCPNEYKCVEVGTRQVCIPTDVVNELGLKEVEENEENEKEDKVCIDVRALSNLKEGDLVYKNHPYSFVLCDGNDSCATPSHMVSFHGKGMMMKTYCEKVGCVKRVMKVNSPNYKVGLRVESRTAGLKYTALAARYETSVEESAMSMVIRLGF